MRGGPHALLRHMTGLPYNPPPRGKHEDPLAPNLVMEEEKTGLAAGLPLVRDRDVWANPDALLPERHELWWDDGTAEPEWYIDRDFARPMSVPLMSAQLLGIPAAGSCPSLQMVTIPSGNTRLAPAAMTSPPGNVLPT